METVIVGRLKFLFNQMRFPLIVLFAVIASYPAQSADRNYAEWGRMAERFFLPLTYPEFDSQDFGVEPNVEDLAIIKRFKPHVYIAPGGIFPVDFYADYLPRSVLRDDKNGGAVVNNHPSREDIKKNERTYGMYLDYQGPPDLKGSPVAYSRLYREKVRIDTGKSHIEVPFTFVKYNFAFVESGLPAKLPWYKRIFVEFAGNPDMWHELDIHGSIIVALIKTDSDYVPVAMILAQHNYFRTYLIGRDIPYPADGRVSASFALRSNEPYPLPLGAEPVEHRSVGSPSDFSYVITGDHFAFSSGVDLVYGKKSGAKPFNYRIEVLPSKDPLYVSWIPLGDKLKLFGVFSSFYRTGPPGIDLNTWPELKEYGKIMKFWFVDDGDNTAALLFKRYFKRFDNVRFKPIMKYNGARFSEELLKLRPALK